MVIGGRLSDSWPRANATGTPSGAVATMDVNGCPIVHKCGRIYTIPNNDNDIYMYSQFLTVYIVRANLSYWVLAVMTLPARYSVVATSISKVCWRRLHSAPRMKHETRILFVLGIGAFRAQFYGNEVIPCQNLWYHSIRYLIALQFAAGSF